VTTYRSTLGDKGVVDLWRKQQQATSTAMAADIRRFFGRQRDAILAALAEKHPSTLSVLSPEKLANELFDPADWTDEFRLTLYPHLYHAVTTGTLAEIAMEHIEKAGRLQPLPRRVTQAVASFFQSLWLAPYWYKIHETTRDNLTRTLAATAGTALGIYAVKGLIRSALGGRAARRRAKAIAEVESTSATNQGRVLGMQVLQLRGYLLQKQWFTRADEKVRPAHEALDGVSVGIDGYFDVGGELAPYPGYFGLSMAQRAGCRCGVRSIQVEPEMATPASLTASLR
jgi:hypothetical protein